MLYAAPDLVHVDLASRMPNESFDDPVDVIGSYGNIAPAGYSGNAPAGTREQGAAVVSALVSFAVPYLRWLDEQGWRVTSPTPPGE
jgi:creatinine amidohydrolase/Fe(II)-dependent formamide hydrolase-like protein